MRSYVTRHPFDGPCMERLSSRNSYQVCVSTGDYICPNRPACLMYLQPLFPFTKQSVTRSRIIYCSITITETVAQRYLTFSIKLPRRLWTLSPQLIRSLRQRQEIILRGWHNHRAPYLCNEIYFSWSRFPLNLRDSS